MEAAEGRGRGGTGAPECASPPPPHQHALAGVRLYANYIRHLTLGLFPHQALPTDVEMKIGSTYVASVG